MIFQCPNCAQQLQADDSQAGRAIECPICDGVIVVPPRMHAPLQPTAPIVAKQKLRFPGCAGAFILLLLMAGGISGYAMYRWHQTPAEAWQHLTLVVQQFVRQKFAPTPAPPPELTPAPAPRAAPRGDAMAWLIEHKDRWPKEVILREPMEFPAVS